MRARILVVEDEREIADLISIYLQEEGMDCTICPTAEAGVEVFGASHFDMVILDINLPGMDGFQFLQNLRRQSDLPVIVVSCRKADEDIMLGFGIGADDFVTKPFSPKVLTARVRSHLNRYQRNAGPRALYCFGDFTLDPDALILKKNGERVILAPRELELLIFLIRSCPRTASTDEIYQCLWGNEYGDISTVAVHIQRLRRKIEPDPAHPVYILNVYGAGYRFNPDTLQNPGGPRS